MENGNWSQRNWRSATAWSYTIVCLFDFMLAPIFLAWFQWVTKSPYTIWEPLTLQGAGLYHLSMGAIVGVTSWSKTKEKIASAINSESSATETK